MRRCPQQNKCVFSNRRNSRKVCSESHRWRGRLFHRRGQATVNERSPRVVRVLGTSHARGDVGRLQSSSAGSRGKLAVVCQILWRQTIHRFVRQNCQLEFNALSHWQPVKLLQNGCDVLTTSGTSNKTCCSILYGLETPEQIVRDAEQQRVTVVKTRRDQCVDHCLRGFGR